MTPMAMMIAMAMMITGFVGIAAINGFPAACATLSAETFEIASLIQLSVIPLFVLITEGDESLQAFGENMISSLFEANFNVTGPKLVVRASGVEVAAEIVKSGEGVLWLDRR